VTTHSYSVSAHRSTNRAWKKAHPEALLKDRKSFRSRYRTMRWKTKVKNLPPLTLSFEEYVELVTPNQCHYGPHSLPEQGSGIDRLDNKLGYISGNCVPCCTLCNSKKGRLESLGFKYPRPVELMKELMSAGGS